MSKPSLLVVLPTYGAYDYAVHALTSVLRNTEHFDVTVSVVDDATPENKRAHFDVLLQAIREETRVQWHQFVVNGGLTRSWNYGLEEGIANNFDYVCVTNSDVYFPAGWDTDIAEALQMYALVGPVTNAPGTEKLQYVKRYSVTYDKKKLQSAEEVAKIQQELLKNQQYKTKQGTINGFCMIAKTATWHANRFDEASVFRPRNEFNASGELNPTPLMTLNEYELQRRWHSRGLKSCVCIRSFVVHYRAVSRGQRYNRGDWLRIF